jgi:hypothetical protein
MSSRGPDRLPVVLELAALDAIEEIAAREEKYADALLRALLSAAWPTRSAQNQ